MFVNDPRSKLRSIAECLGTDVMPEASFAVSNRKKELMKRPTRGPALCPFEGGIGGSLRIPALR